MTEEIIIEEVTEEQRLLNMYETFKTALTLAAKVYGWTPRTKRDYHNMFVETVGPFKIPDIEKFHTAINVLLNNLVTDIVDAKAERNRGFTFRSWVI